ncbi:mannose-6-phosphate isomerase, class I [Vibrio sp. LaRot3]|uniref:mannose-6-phosphate isomerase, class I n=1 Tax=Vibrio sp. LaRot3 TaxID=2998829 RepID=UPI0022CDCCDC|nr:mannose-6-phosphate isomerase, class I [Vibrio sp. LaRot3]MDA0149785.1 mannose-6-phosphate isomerase, class I [Vibrio sp. LaRot3]
MENVIQNYPWGCKSSLSELFNIENTAGVPQAELWMGAHPNGCSKVSINDVQQDLASVIKANPSAILGEKSGHQSAQLPFLFKVLCAEKALSIQVHPSQQRAQFGFAEEERQGTPLDAFNRNYKDPNHKPELVYALTQYTAMNGFRHIPEILSLFEAVGSAALKPLLEEFALSADSQGLQNFFEQLLTMDGEIKEKAVQDLIEFATVNPSTLNSQIIELSHQYPNDIGLFAPLILNVVTLEPGDAMYLDAETPHAYIKGTGLEIMANSDNVLRAGLTNKHLDVPELIANTRFVETPSDSILLMPHYDHGALNYAVPVTDFKFSILISPRERRMEVESAEILLAIDAAVYLEHLNGETCSIEKGQSVFIPAVSGEYKITSSGRVARAYY